MGVNILSALCRAHVYKNANCLKFFKQSFPDQKRCRLDISKGNVLIFLIVSLQILL
jgi:hypothetical protein